MPALPRQIGRVLALSALAGMPALWTGFLRAQLEAAPEAVEFNRDIRPILSDRCFACHGPDASNRQANLRLDVEADAKADLGGGRFAIVPGDAARSEVYRRIIAKSPARRMPPAYLGHAPLSEREIDLIRRWIEQGARWERHWAFIAPRRHPLPQVSRTDWPRNEIDYFVLARLEREGLSPSPEADRATLIRRVTLDLTGLPPTPAEVDAFLEDPSPQAYERVVDRLLASPRYGERMAIGWLEAARYADTNGYQTDAERYMWRWRDWVIEAFNRNMPFDQFTVEQIAGDMLPGATLEQKIATGFNRNHRGNGEGGIIPEEYAVEYVADRVETTATVFLGLTLGCARCHDHKYDPISQKEYYQVFAYFNNVPEKGRANKYGNSPPMIPAPTREQQRELRELEAKIHAAHQAFAALRPEIASEQRRWESSLDASVPDCSVSRGLIASFSMEGSPANSIAAKAADPPPSKFAEGEPVYARGPVGQAASFDGKRYIDAGDVAHFGFYDKFTLSAWIYPTSPTGAILTRTQDVPEMDGYGVYLKDGKVQVNLVQRWLDDALRVETAEPVALNRWSHIAVTYDGSRVADGVKIYVDGRAQTLAVLLDELNQSFAVKEPFRIGAGGGPENRFGGLIDEVRVYTVALAPREVHVLAVSQPVFELAGVPPEGRSAAQQEKLRFCFLEHHASEKIRQAWRSVNELDEQRERYLERLPTVMVMEELPTPRETRVLIRGAYDNPGERVSPGVPAVLPPLPEGVPNNRLGLARWLVDPSNPLTARVIVNRFWQMYFGTGLVKTVEDFGSQGEWPSHPELLDWLATELLRTGWDVKALQKKIATSATYRQSSKVSPELLQRDPENRLLARGPRLRLPAEMIRDQALAVSGLLVEKLGGPSVKPYQPAGLWRELSGGADYQRDQGEKLYRRSLYTFWKRTVPPPMMMTFDAASRETCVVRQARTNTPLQALGLMNDVTFLEAARVMAERIVREAGPDPESRLAYAFRLATARRPKPREREVLLGSFHHFLERFEADREAAVQFLNQGEYPRDTKLDASELAAYAAVCSLILNLDEVVTKQ